MNAPTELLTILNARSKDLNRQKYAYELGTPGQFGLDVVVNEDPDVDESSMSFILPFADGRRRDGVGDLLEVGGINCERHQKNPVSLLDHGKQVLLPIGKCEDPATGAYTVEIDPVSKIARARVFIYQGKGLANTDPAKENEHALLCAQIFDLWAKRFIRAGSIGYQVVAGRELGPDYETGTPKGVHLLNVLMLECSTVVMPANMDTVKGLRSPADLAKEVLCMGAVCGKPLSPVLVKSFSAFAPEKKVMLGWEGKSETVPVPLANIPDTKIPPPEWKPGVGAEKSLSATTALILGALSAGTMGWTLGKLMGWLSDHGVDEAEAQSAIMDLQKRGNLEVNGENIQKKELPRQDKKAVEDPTADYRVVATGANGERVLYRGPDKEIAYRLAYQAKKSGLYNSVVLHGETTGPRKMKSLRGKYGEKASPSLSFRIYKVEKGNDDDGWYYQFLGESGEFGPYGSSQEARTVAQDEMWERQGGFDRKKSLRGRYGEKASSRSGTIVCHVCGRTVGWEMLPNPYNRKKEPTIVDHSGGYGASCLGSGMILNIEKSLPQSKGLEVRFEWRENPSGTPWERRKIWVRDGGSERQMSFTDLAQQYGQEVAKRMISTSIRKGTSNWHEVPGVKSLPRHGTKSLDMSSVRKKYRPTKTLRRRLRKSVPGSSLVHVAPSDLNAAREMAEAKGLKFDHVGSVGGLSRVKLMGDDSGIDAVAQEFGKSVRGRKSFPLQGEKVFDPLSTTVLGAAASAAVYTLIFTDWENVYKTADRVLDYLFTRSPSEVPKDVQKRERLKKKKEKEILQYFEDLERQGKVEIQGGKIRKRKGGKSLPLIGVKRCVVEQESDGWYARFSPEGDGAPDYRQDMGPFESEQEVRQIVTRQFPGLFIHRKGISRKDLPTVPIPARIVKQFLYGMLSRQQAVAELVAKAGLTREQAESEIAAVEQDIRSKERKGIKGQKFIDFDYARELLKNKYPTASDETLDKFIDDMDIPFKDRDSLERTWQQWQVNHERGTRQVFERSNQFPEEQSPRSYGYGRGKPAGSGGGSRDKQSGGGTCEQGQTRKNSGCTPAGKSLPSRSKSTGDTEFNQGVAARLSGEQQNDNPYPLGSEAADSWNSGWVGGQGKMMKKKDMSTRGSIDLDGDVRRQIDNSGQMLNYAKPGNGGHYLYFAPGTDIFKVRTALEQGGHVFKITGEAEGWVKPRTKSLSLRRGVKSNGIKPGDRVSVNGGGLTGIVVSISDGMASVDTVDSGGDVRDFPLDRLSVVGKSLRGRKGIFYAFVNGKWQWCDEMAVPIRNQAPGRPLTPPPIGWNASGSTDYVFDADSEGWFLDKGLSGTRRKSLKAKGKSMDNTDDVYMDDDPLAEASKDMGMNPEHPFSAQVLKRLHEKALEDLEEGDSWMSHLEHPEVKKFVQKHLEGKAAHLDEIEALHAKHHPELPGLGDAETKDLDEEELGETEGELDAIGDELDDVVGDLDEEFDDTEEDKDLDTIDRDAVPADSESEDEPTPEEALEGMETADGVKHFRRPLRRRVKSLKDEEFDEEFIGKRLRRKGIEEIEELTEDEKRLIRRKRMERREVKSFTQVGADVSLDDGRTGKVVKIHPDGWMKIRFDDPYGGNFEELVNEDRINVTTTKRLQGRGKSACPECGGEDCDCTKSMDGPPPEFTDQIDNGIEAMEEKGLEDHEMSKVGEAAQFANELATSDALDEEKRMKAFHYHKTLEGMGHIEDLAAEQKSEFVGDPQFWQEEGAEAEHKDMGTEHPGAMAGSAEEAAVNGPAAEAQIPPAKSIHPHRQACKDAAQFFGDTASTKDWGEPHKQHASVVAKALEEVAAAPINKPEPVTDEAVIEVGEMGEKSRRFLRRRKSLKQDIQRVLSSKFPGKQQDVNAFISEYEMETEDDLDWDDSSQSLASMGIPSQDVITEFGDWLASHGKAKSLHSLKSLLKRKGRARRKSVEDKEKEEEEAKALRKNLIEQQKQVKELRRMINGIGNMTR